MVNLLLALHVPSWFWVTVLTAELVLACMITGLVALSPNPGLHPTFASGRLTRLGRALITLAWCGFSSTLLARLLSRLGLLPVAPGSSDGLVAATIVAGAAVLAHILFVYMRD